MKTSCVEALEPRRLCAAGPYVSASSGTLLFNQEVGVTSHPQYLTLSNTVILYLINELDTIDLHHGTHSANPPYTVLEVIGTGISAKLKAEVSQFGFDEFQETLQGFRAVRPMPTGEAARS